MATRDYSTLFKQYACVLYNDGPTNRMFARADWLADSLFHINRIETVIKRELRDKGSSNISIAN